MKTEIIKINTSDPAWREMLQYPAQVLRSGGLVAFPTETVYGLGASIFNQKALKGIYRAKGRPADNPLIVHVADAGIVAEITSSIPSCARELMEAFWPGPLTLIMPKSGGVSPIVTAGLDTVAVRMPSNPIALELIRKSGVPVAAPSANTSGKPSPTNAGHVISDLSGKVDVIIDGGSTEVGVESTVLDITVNPPVILRPGGITSEQLKSFLGEISFTPADNSGANVHVNSVPRSPGMKYRHYAPNAALLLFRGRPESVAAEIGRRAELYNNEGNSVGILVTDETAALYEPSLYTCCRFIFLGSRSDPEELASNLFSSLREFDENGVDVILAEAPDAGGIGEAVMNRLLKASGGNMIEL